MTQLYTSDSASAGFDATTVNSLPSGWLGISGTWSVGTAAPLTGHIHSFADTSKTNLSIAVNTGASAAADMEVAFAQTFRVSGLNGTCCGGLARANAAGTNYYLAFIDSPTNCVLFSCVGGSLAQIGSGSALGFTVADGDVILTRFQVVGTSLKAKFWKAGSAEPTSWSITATDSAVTAAGYGGLMNLEAFAGAQASVSDFSVDSVASGSQTVLTLAPSQPITASGGNITVSGTYTGTAPSGLDAAVDGGSFSSVSSPTISGGNFSFATTSPANGYHTVTVRDSGNTTHTSSGIYDVSGAASTQTIAPNDAAIVYSPYNWQVNGTIAVSINPGAYFRSLFGGATAVLNFDVSAMGSPASQIWWRIDYGTWTKADVAATVSLTIPSDTLSNTDIPYHALEVVFKSQDSSGNNRWNTGSTGTALKFTGLAIDSGASVHAPATLPKTLLLYGDSIAEGIRTVGEAAANTTDCNDALQCWSYRLRDALGAEVGVVGLGGTGFTSTFANCPVFSTSYNLVFSGQSRSFSPAPDLTIVNHGANDGGASSGTITANATSAFNGLLGAFAAKPIVALDVLPQSFSGAATVRTAVQAAVTGIGNARLTWVSASGMFSTTYGADSTGLHPSGPNDQFLIAPAIAAALSPLLYPSSGGGAPTSGGYIIGAS